MTGNAWMFYLSLGIFVPLAVTYLVLRVWIIVRKYQLKKQMKKGE